MVSNGEAGNRLRRGTDRGQAEAGGTQMAPFSKTEDSY